MARYVKFFGLGGGADGFITGSCNDIQTTSYLQANGPEANINVAIIPKGTGAIIASCPDGTATGGNARGVYAVDLQMSRTNSTQVAGGRFDVIAGGENNFISIHNDGHRFIGSGYQNAITIAGSSVIAGGSQNSISGPPSAFSTISGGQQNTASTNTHATVVGGQSNTASGQHSVAGGRSNTASGLYSVAIGYNNTSSDYASTCFGSGNNASGGRSFVTGDGCTASGDRSVVLGGQNNQATSANSVSSGYYGYTYLMGQSSISNRFGATGLIGQSQISKLISSGLASLSSGSTTTLSLDGTGITNLIIPYGNNRLWSAKITATAFVSAVSGTTLVLGDSYMAEYTVLFKRVGGVSSVVGTNAGSVIADTNMISSAFTFSAGASQELAITFKAPTTANADTFRCVAKVELVEVAY